MSDMLMNTGRLSVKKALEEILVNQDFLGALTTKEARLEWESFGKMNSHIYRRMLFALFEKAKMKKESQFMVFFLFSVVKNVNRVLVSMEGLPEEFRNAVWFTEVKNFLQANVVQYVSEVGTTKKFPAVNIPNCFPGADILGYVLQQEETDITEMFRRPTTTQLHLSEQAQVQAKAGYMFYWENVVTSTKNTNQDL